VFARKEEETMSVARAAGYPDYSSAGTSDFIPEIWSGKLLTKLYAKQVLAAISNTDYEGEIKDFGDKVIVRTIPDGTINDYYKGMELTFEHLESPSVTLNIDHGKYFGAVVDSIDIYQSDIKLLDKWATMYGEKMANSIDTHVLASLKAACSADNLDNTAGVISTDILLGATAAPFQVTKENVIDFIIDCGVVLGEQNVPKEGCWMVVPEWFGGIISKSDLKDASMTGDGKSVLRNGRIGIIWPFEIFLSNNLPTTTDTVTCWDVPFGNKIALTYASQFTTMKRFDPEKSFGEGIKGLNVFGHKVMIDEAIGCGYVRK
jgi:hypothetical protein